VSTVTSAAATPASRNTRQGSNPHRRPVISRRPKRSIPDVLDGVELHDV
jgi:hypothetical protein